MNNSWQVCCSVTPPDWSVSLTTNHSLIWLILGEKRKGTKTKYKTWTWACERKVKKRESKDTFNHHKRELLNFSGMMDSFLSGETPQNRCSHSHNNSLNVLNYFYIIYLKVWGCCQSRWLKAGMLVQNSSPEPTGDHSWCVGPHTNQTSNSAKESVCRCTGREKHKSR